MSTSSGSGVSVQTEVGGVGQEGGGEAVRGAQQLRAEPEVAVVGQGGGRGGGRRHLPEDWPGRAISLCSESRRRRIGSYC